MNYRRLNRILFLGLLLCSAHSYGQSTVVWGESNSRTERRDDAGLQGNAEARSGFYDTPNPVNFPAGASSWWHLLDVRHVNPVNNYAMQFAGSFFDQNLYFRKTNNNASQSWSRVLLETDGKVAIGTTSPNGLLSLGSSISNRKLLVYDDGTDVTGLTQTNGELRLFGATSGTNHISFGKYQLSNDAFFEQMRITLDGNVAIGTSDPKGYKLAVAGNAIAESVTVKLQGQWGDYVFKPAYKLRPLGEVKYFIDQHHHLPEIPPAKEIEKSGIDLGEMVKLQMKKIEELTLYLIEKDKQVTELAQRLNTLEKTITKPKN